MVPSTKCRGHVVGFQEPSLPLLKNSALPFHGGGGRGRVQQEEGTDGSCWTVFRNVLCVMYSVNEVWCPLNTASFPPPPRARAPLCLAR